MTLDLSPLATIAACTLGAAMAAVAISAARTAHHQHQAPPPRGASLLRATTRRTGALYT